ncbi:uncharacterized protein LOC111051325 [Nilaparvata lugens]|uniref:uncharacterized protein LOC111051325 n=1 Tax=Nilaparvata lugens TaxID=108931 RepID=UPI00193CFBCE|nr:uncharacterized protein LOC111051325 [Nilaparvata lugens]
MLLKVINFLMIIHLLPNLLEKICCSELRPMQNVVLNNDNIEFLDIVRNNSENLTECTTRNHKSFQNKSANSIGLSIMPEDKMLDAWSKPDNTFQMFGNPNSQKSTQFPQLNGRKRVKYLLKDEARKVKSPKQQIDEYKKRVMMFLVQKGFVTNTQPTSTSTEKIKDDLKSTKERGKNILQAMPIK